MIHLFAGDDTKNKTASYEKFAKSVPSAAEIFFINHNNFNQTEIESLYSGSNLFSSLTVVVFSGILEREELQDFLLGKLEPMNKSSNYFIFREGKLGKKVLDAFKKVKAELNVFELPKEKTEKFNNFLLANAFGVRDKLNLWIYFRQAINKGVGMEELIGVLFWKIKDMIIKKDFRKFSPVELQNSASRLSYLLPEAREKGRDAEASFEQFLLEAF